MNEERAASGPAKRHNRHPRNRGEFFLSKTSRKQPAPDPRNSLDRRWKRPAVLMAVAAAVVAAAWLAAVRLGCTTRPDGDFGEPGPGGAAASGGLLLRAAGKDDVTGG